MASGPRGTRKIIYLKSSYKLAAKCFDEVLGCIDVFYNWDGYHDVAFEVCEYC